MCLLVVSEPNSTPKKKQLEVSSCNNPHGFGYAVITPTGIITGKGMSSKKVIKEFLEVRKEYPNSYAMFHARYATHGVKNQENCHPFMVGGRDDTYLAHNGILDISIHQTDKRSDTRIFAEDVLPRMGGAPSLDDENVWKILSKWASGNKIAVFTLDPKAKWPCYIINEHLGHWDNEGNWWSNDGYKQSTWSSWLVPTQTSGEPTVGYSDTLPDDYECGICRTVAYEDANPYYCETCLGCFDCKGVYGDNCMCWIPEYDRYATNKKENWYYDKHFDFAK
jgi:hypothetical protein